MRSVPRFSLRSISRSRKTDRGLHEVPFSWSFSLCCMTCWDQKMSSGCCSRPLLFQFLETDIFASSTIEFNIITLAEPGTLHDSGLCRLHRVREYDWRRNANPEHRVRCEFCRQRSRVSAFALSPLPLRCTVRVSMQFVSQGTLHESRVWT